MIVLQLIWYGDIYRVGIYFIEMMSDSSICGPQWRTIRYTDSRSNNVGNINIVTSFW